MTTRYANRAVIRQNSFASDPLYVEARGVNGSAAAAKARLLSNEQARGLIHFLQSRSLTEDGLRGVAQELVEMFPERLGSRRMFERGIKPGKIYSEDDAIKIDRQLGLGAVHDYGSCVDFDVDRKRLLTKADDLVNQCREKAKGMSGFLVRLCVDPRMEIETANEPGDALAYRTNFKEVLPDLAEQCRQQGGFTTAELPYFKNIVGALLEYQAHYNQRAAEQIAMTTVAKQVFGALDYALKTRRMVLISGNSGVGKSEATRAWCDMHRDRARYVQLTGITNRTNFFRRLATALGVCEGMGLSASKVQARCESFMEKSKLMLAIDEAQYCWPPGERAESQPELINWLNTACHNNGVPVALIATNEFHRRRKAIERNTSWSSEQLSRRIGRAFDLPAVPTDDDLIMVAGKLLPTATKQIVGMVVAYAKASQRYMPAIGDVRDDARLICEDAGRSEITAADVAQAIKEFRLPSDEIMRRHSEPEIKSRSRKSPPPLPLGRAELSEPISSHGSRAAVPLQMPGRTREIKPTIQTEKV